MCEWLVYCVYFLCVVPGLLTGSIKDLFKMTHLNGVWWLTPGIPDVETGG